MNSHDFGLFNELPKIAATSQCNEHLDLDSIHLFVITH
jgi:hypothetical protein